MLKGHGADIYDYGDILADFSSNVSWVDYTDVLGPMIAKRVGELGGYPDVGYRELRGELAGSYGLSMDHFLVTNGAVSGIYQCAQAYGGSGSRSALFYPEFSEYECALMMYGHEVDFFEVGELGGVSGDCGFVMLGNPGNPSGRLLSRGGILDFVDACADRVVVVDESYMEFAGSSESVISGVSERVNLIVIKSFTKRYSIPGLRLGYVVAHPDVCEFLNGWSQPWSVNSLAAGVGCEILRSPEKFPFDVVGYEGEKRRFYEALCEISELDVRWSEANYFLITLDGFSAAEVKKYLADERQLLVRDASNFRGLSGNSIRVAVRSVRDNDLLVDGLRCFFRLSGEGGEV